MSAARAAVRRTAPSKPQTVADVNNRRRAHAALDTILAVRPVIDGLSGDRLVVIADLLEWVADMPTGEAA